MRPIHSKNSCNELVSEWSHFRLLRENCSGADSHPMSRHTDGRELLRDFSVRSLFGSGWIDVTGVVIVWSEDESLYRD